MKEEKIQKLAEFTEKNPGVDVTPLLKENLQPPPNRLRVYLISFLFPPFGLYYTVKYLFLDNDSEAKQRLGWIALGLTVGVIVLAIATFSAVASSFLKSHPSIEQNPSNLLQQYRDITQ